MTAKIEAHSMDHLGACPECGGRISDGRRHGWIVIDDRFRVHSVCAATFRARPWQDRRQRWEDTNGGGS